MKTQQQPHINVRADMGTVGIAGVLMQHLRVNNYAPVELRGIGPGAVNQAVKGMAIAFEKLRQERGVLLVCTPRIEDGNDKEGGSVSRVSLLVEVRP